MKLAHVFGACLTYNSNSTFPIEVSNKINSAVDIYILFKAVEYRKAVEYGRVELKACGWVFVTVKFFSETQSRINGRKLKTRNG